MQFIRDLNTLNKDDVAIAGGKGASLGEMTKTDIPVPPGFVVTAETFEEYNSEIPDTLAAEILKSFDELGADKVAVRSSATAEDSASAAWAGQLDSFLNTRREDLLENIKKCWASLYTPRAVFYRQEHNLNDKKISVAVVVQKMVQSEVAGVAFSVHPVTEDKNKIIIEAVFGLGERLVSGEVTPDNYIVQKEPRQILEVNVSGKQQALTKEQILELSEFVLKIEKHYGFPCDIEWAFEKGKFYIVQSRPITTLLEDQSSKKISQYEKFFSRDFSLPSVEAWVRGESTNPKQWTNLTQPFLPYIVVQHSDDTAHFYYDIQGVEWVQDLLVKLAKEGITFLEKIGKTVLEKLKYLQPIYEEERILDLEELKKFIKELEGGYPWFEAMWWFCQMDPAKLEGIDITNIQKVRVHTDTLCNGSDTVIRKSLSKIYPNLGELSSMLSTSEIISGNIPSIEELEKRDRGYFFGNGVLSVDTNIAEAENVFGVSFIQEIVTKSLTEFSGEIAQKGITRGIVRRVMGHKQIGQIKEGEILVSPMTIPDFLPAIKKAAAIITDEGGITCHAAIVAREFKKPCIVGTKIATKVLKDGDIVEVDANSGVVRIVERYG